MVVPRKEKAYEKYAWIIFFALGILFLAEGLGYTIARPPLEGFSNVTGLNLSQFEASYPKVVFFFVHMINAWALGGIIGPVLLMAVSFKSYRKGEKWAWYAFWIVPAFILANALWFSDLVTRTDPVITALVFLLIPLLGLFLP